MVQILRDTYKAGHQIGSHSWSHPHAAGLTDAQFDLQITLVDEALVKILGVRPAHYRPPYGEISESNLNVLTRHNYTVAALWDAVSGPGTNTPVDASNAMYAQRAGQFPSPHMVLNHEQDTVSSLSNAFEAYFQLIYLPSAGFHHSDPSTSYPRDPGRRLQASQRRRVPGIARLPMGWRTSRTGCYLDMHRETRPGCSAIVATPLIATLSTERNSTSIDLKPALLSSPQSMNLLSHCTSGGQILTFFRTSPKTQDDLRRS
jgi:hypothetical protein